MKAKLLFTLFMVLSILSNVSAQCPGWLPAPQVQVYIIDANPAKITCFTIPNGGSGPFTYLWTFGDGTTSTLASPTHIYNTVGQYNVVLVVTDGSGCSMTIANPINFAQPCTSHFTANNNGSNTVHFDGSTSTGYWGHNVWDFGDGVTETNSTMSPDHIYNAPGLYTACQTVSWPDNNCNSTFCDTVRVNNFSCGTNTQLIDTLFANNEVHFGIGGTLVVFPGNGLPASNLHYSLNYGDGSAPDSTFRHTYAQPGTYNVCVSVTGQVTGANVYPCTSYGCTTISINNCSFVPFRDSVVAPQTVLFTNDNGNNAGGGGCGGGSLVHWDFGDGVQLDTFAAAIPIYHHFPHDGTYTVCLRMTSANGCQAILCQQVVVQGGVCNMSIGIVKTPAPHGQDNLFAEVFGGTGFGNYTFNWNYNNEQNQDITVPIGSNYCVTATDIYTGCSATACDSSAFCRTQFSTEYLTFNTLRFTDLSGNFSDRSWDFGDGTTSTLENPTHLFTGLGTFHVCLNTSNLPLNPCDPLANYPTPCPPQCTIGQYCQDIVVSQVDTSCLHTDCVFPGDVNKDQIVNNYDLLPFGIGYGIYGTPRIASEQGSVFYGHSAPTWTQTIASGNINYKHLDCDGDGYIYYSDVNVINGNYGRTHNWVVPTNRPMNTAGIPISVQFTADTVRASAGTYTMVYADIMVGTAAQPATSIYGLAFTINYPGGMAATSNNYVQYDYNSWFGTGSQTLNLFHDTPATGQMDVAFVRTNRINKTGFGRIASVSWVITDNINGRGLREIAEAFTASISGLRIIDRLNIEKPGEGLPTSTVVVFNHPTATTAENEWQNQVAVFPNPADEQLTINLTNIRANSLTLQNALGQTVITDIINERTTTKIDIHTLPAGVYTLTVITEKGNVSKKVVIQ